jgi:dolichol kinase
MSVLLVTGLLLVWNLVVLHFISRWFYLYLKRFERIPAEYVTRKVIHVLTGGVTTIVTPIFYEGHYWIVAIAAFFLAGYIYLKRRSKLMYWFQVRENTYEVHFAIAFGVALMIGVFLGDVWIGLIPALFMSFGDSATGLVRAFTQKRQTKSWDGTIAMFGVCMAIGYWRLGLYGIFIGLVVGLIERIPKIDDNITVPIVAAALVYVHRFILF